MFHTQGSTAFRLLELLNAGGATADAIMEFFAPICPCDAATWVKTKLQQNDPEIVSLINTLIARPEVPQPPKASTEPWPGFLVGTTCVAGALQGNFAFDTMVMFNVPIPTSAAC